ncbi:MAG: glycoside hydrolase family 32 protein [Lachnospiraceae bacterium]|nr:glycoside hydrolase family 32 protein [Lachnospiraceae bacterium]
MVSQILKNARIYEQDKERLIKEEERPAFHLSARVGWMNDPNGFSFYDGKYHLFYQYHPFDSHWGPMHWGHAVSRDLLHWTYLPCVMAPDRYYDRDGCFSGCAFTMPDGSHAFIYTGVATEVADNGEVRMIQTQNLAFGDGLFYEKSAENPVISAKDLPEGGSPYDFRDPKMFLEENGVFHLAVANHAEGRSGCILHYRSRDLVHWEYVSTLAANDYRIGLMWECPDFFRLDGKWVLLASAQDMLPKGLEYYSGNGTFYLVGDFDVETGEFKAGEDHAVDYGIDYYAMQTVQAPDGRRIMIGWMQNWDTCNLRTASVPWFGQMALPREVWLQDGLLYQQPVRELLDLRKDEVVYENLPICGREVELAGVCGRLLDLELSVEALDPSDIYKKFSVRFAKNERYNTGLSYRPHERTLKLDRKYSGSRRAIMHQRRARVEHENGRISLRIVLDRFSVEVFVNGGEKVMSATLETETSAEGVSFYCDGAARISLKKYSLG